MYIAYKNKNGLCSNLIIYLDLLSYYCYLPRLLIYFSKLKVYSLLNK